MNKKIKNTPQKPFTDKHSTKIPPTGQLSRLTTAIRNDQIKKAAQILEESIGVTHPQLVERIIRNFQESLGLEGVKNA
jgi:hypothetical protein